jgi:hypothetical protein
VALEEKIPKLRFAARSGDVGGLEEHNFGKSFFLVHIQFSIIDLLSACRSSDPFVVFFDTVDKFFSFAGPGKASTLEFGSELDYRLGQVPRFHHVDAVGGVERVVESFAPG